MAILALAGVLALGACNPGADPPAGGAGGVPVDSPDPAAAPADTGQPPLRTDRREYTLRADGEWERASIGFTYHNPLDQRLYHPTCRPGGGDPTVAVAVQRRTAVGWETVWSPALPQCLSEPIEIAPRGVYRDTLDLVLHPQDSVHQPHLTPRTPLDGEYRLVWHSVLSSYDPEAYPFGNEISLEHRVSNPFRLRR